MPTEAWACFFTIKKIRFSQVAGKIFLPIGRFFNYNAANRVDGTADG